MHPDTWKRNHSIRIHLDASAGTKQSAGLSGNKCENVSQNIYVPSSGAFVTVAIQLSSFKGRCTYSISYTCMYIGIPAQVHTYTKHYMLQVCYKSTRSCIPDKRACTGIIGNYTETCVVTFTTHRVNISRERGALELDPFTDAHSANLQWNLPKNLIEQNNSPLPGSCVFRSLFFHA